MAEMKLTKRQRENLSKTFLDLCKAIFIGLIIAQIAISEKFSVTVFIIGSILFLLFLFIGIFSDRGE